MAELALIMSMITVTSTATSILGIIKRRCGASGAIVELVNKCAELVKKIQKLLKTLKRDAQIPCNTYGISTALSLRREEFDAILKNLEKIKRRTKRTHPVDRTEKFIKAQGWAKNVEAVYNDLVHLRNGVENIVSNWDVVQFVAAKFEGVVTIDVSKEKDSRRYEQHEESEMMESTTVTYVDRIQMTMLKLTKANKDALNRVGNLDKLSLPDALYEAGTFVFGTDKTCFIQLMEHSAELLSPLANCWMGLAYKFGFLMEKDTKLALFHLRAASSRGDVPSVMRLIAHYDHENDMENVVKYLKATSHTAAQRNDPILWDYYNGADEKNLIRASKSMRALDQSYVHFYGIGDPKSNEKAIEALPTFDSVPYSVYFDDDNSASVYILPHHYGTYFLNDYLRTYFDFLFKSNQFLPFFIWSYDLDIYSPREWKRRVLHAANNQCVDAHIFLAQYYSSFGHRNEWEMKRHLRIAADARHSQAQSICRQMFGRNANVRRGLKQEEKRRDDNQEKEIHRSRRKKSEKKEEDSRKKATVRISSKCDTTTK